MASTRSGQGLAYRAGRLIPSGLRPFARRQLVRVRFRGLTSSDVMLVSFPKSGSTWLRFMLAQVLTGEEADFDSIRRLIPPIGSHRHAPQVLPGGRRLVRTHEPLVPYQGARGEPVIYLVRRGDDVLLSYADHVRRQGGNADDMRAFADQFIAGTFDGYGAWHEHVLGALQHRADGMPFLLVRYEDLRTDTAAELDRVLEFVGGPRDADAITAAVALNSKEGMRAKEATSTQLARTSVDGTPFVRPERAHTIDDVVDPATATRVRDIIRPAMVAVGYDL
jgi:hypothetical protein